ncbi:MAG: N-acetylglucosamine-6-phosphate deacetylase [Candidatus Nanopelagicales bacterium]
MTTFSAPKLLVGSEIIGPGAVVVHDGLIHQILDHIPAAASDHVRLTSGMLAPGMIDLQINGCFGVDFADASPEQWALARQRLARTGVTSFLPTLITASISQLSHQLKDVAREQRRVVPGGAQVLGAHVEGPFLSPVRAGAHDVALLVDPTQSRIEDLLSSGADAVVLVVTLAPERPGALAAIRQLRERGVIVSAGHTDATAEQLSEAADAGATMITHLFNAQRGLHHREPGVAGAGLADPRYRLGLIADLHHVAGTVVKIAFQAAPDRVVLVTNAVAAMGMPPGTSTLGGEPTIVDGDGQPARRDDGTLAGSTLTLDQAVRNVVGLGVNRATALGSATSVPADVIGRADLGRIAVGAAADLVWWDESLSVLEVWLGGAPVGLH